MAGTIFRVVAGTIFRFQKTGPGSLLVGGEICRSLTPSRQVAPMTTVAAPPMSKPRTQSPKAASAARLPRCVVVEDHQMFGDLLAISFAAAPDVAVDIVEIAPSVAAGIAACDRHKPDVVLLDLKLPDGPGNAVAEHVAATLPETRVIVVSGQSSTFVCPPELA